MPIFLLERDNNQLKAFTYAHAMLNFTKYLFSRKNMEQRKDVSMAAIIEESISVKSDFGSNAAWDYLIDRGISRSIILRILAFKDRRRCSSGTHGDLK